MGVRVHMRRCMCVKLCVCLGVDLSSFTPSCVNLAQVLFVIFLVNRSSISVKFVTFFGTVVRINKDYKN